MIAANKHGNYGVPMLSVLQETSRDKSTPSKKTTEGLIERLSSDGWLAERLVLVDCVFFRVKGGVTNIYFWKYQRNGIVSLGVRSILELDGYFRLEFPNIIFDCLLCHDIIVSPVSSPLIFHNL